ncbi:MAG: putative transposase [Parvicellaceae bacterium]|jgi:putative transposase
MRQNRSILSNSVSMSLVKVCEEIEERYDVHFLEIGLDGNHVHFLFQSVPTLSPSEVVQMIKSITAREIFRLHPEVKEILWGGQFWSNGYYINTVGQYANEEVIRKYVQNQGDKTEYKMLHENQLILF